MRTTGACPSAIWNSGRVRRGSVLRRRVRARAIPAAAALVVALITVAGAGAATAGAATFTAHGSARTGVRHRPCAQRADVAAEPERDDGRTRRKPTRSAGCCSGTCRPASGYRVRSTSTGERVGPDHRPLRRGGAVGSEHLQPVDPRQRLHVSDHARRHQARDRRPPADEPGGRAGCAVGMPVPRLPAPSLRRAAPLERHVATTATRRRIRR